MTEGQPASSSGRVIQPLWQGLFAGEWDGGGSTSGKVNLGGCLASLGAGSIGLCLEEARVQGQGMVPMQGQLET